MMTVCYVAIDVASSSALEGAYQDREHTEAVMQWFKIGRDA
jgi:hypothetical protein